MTQEQLNEILKPTPANNEFMRGYRAGLEAAKKYISSVPIESSEKRRLIASILQGLDAKLKEIP